MTWICYCRFFEEIKKKNVNSVSKVIHVKVNVFKISIKRPLVTSFLVFFYKEGTLSQVDRARGRKQVGGWQTNALSAVYTRYKG